MTPPAHYLHTIGECLVLWASGSDSTAAVDRLTVQDLKDKPRAKSVDSLIRWRRAYLALRQVGAYYTARDGGARLRSRGAYSAGAWSVLMRMRT